MAVGAGYGAVKPVTVQCSGRYGFREARHASVMERVELGFMRRMSHLRGMVPVRMGVRRWERSVAGAVAVSGVAMAYGGVWKVGYILGDWG